MTSHSLKTGISFGLASGVITTLGLIVGLESGTHSRSVVLSGIMVIAVADALSDALGIHMSEESEGKHQKKEVWASSVSTFLAKLVFASTFAVPFLLLPLQTSVVISLVWGFSLLAAFSAYLAKKANQDPWKVVAEHLLTAFVVIAITYYIGKFAGSIAWD